MFAGDLARVFMEISQQIHRPIIAGGLLQYPEEMRAVFNSGVLGAVSVSKKLFGISFILRRNFCSFAEYLYRDKVLIYAVHLW